MLGTGGNYGFGSGADALDGWFGFSLSLAEGSRRDTRRVLSGCLGPRVFRDCSSTSNRLQSIRAHKRRSKGAWKTKNRQGEP